MVLTRVVGIMIQISDCCVLFRLHLQSPELLEEESLVQLLDFAPSMARVTKEDSTKEKIKNAWVRWWEGGLWIR